MSDMNSRRFNWSHCIRFSPAAPKSVVFGPLPTTTTGKIQKFVLRERTRALQ